jgi:hypothetical protein
MVTARVNPRSRTRSPRLAERRKRSGRGADYHCRRVTVERLGTAAARTRSLSE